MSKRKARTPLLDALIESVLNDRRAKLDAFRTEVLCSLLFAGNGAPVVADDGNGADDDAATLMPAQPAEGGAIGAVFDASNWR